MRRRKSPKGIKRDYTDCRATLIQLGSNLHALRAARGWSLRETIDILNSLHIGVNLGGLARLERGEAMVVVGTVIRLARFYGVPVADLLGRDLSLDDVDPLPPIKKKGKDNKLGEW